MVYFLYNKTSAYLRDGVRERRVRLDTRLVRDGVRDRRRGTDLGVFRLDGVRERLARRFVATPPPCQYSHMRVIRGLGTNLGMFFCEVLTV